MREGKVVEGQVFRCQTMGKLSKLTNVQEDFLPGGSFMAYTNDCCACVPQAH